MGYDARKAAWDRVVSSSDAPPGVYVRIEDEACTLRVGKVEVTVAPGLALEHGLAVWGLVRAEHPELWAAKRPRQRLGA